MSLMLIIRAIISPEKVRSYSISLVPSNPSRGETVFKSNNWRDHRITWHRSRIDQNGSQVEGQKIQWMASMEKLQTARAASNNKWLDHTLCNRPHTLRIRLSNRSEFLQMNPYRISNWLINRNHKLNHSRVSIWQIPSTNASWPSQNHSLYPVKWLFQPNVK